VLEQADERHDAASHVDLRLEQARLQAGARAALRERSSTSSSRRPMRLIDHVALARSTADRQRRRRVATTADDLFAKLCFLVVDEADKVVSDEKFKLLIQNHHCRQSNRMHTSVFIHLY
jgi:hypothetical protein